MLAKTLKRAGFGFLLGVFVCDLIVILTMKDSPVPQSLIETAGSLRAAMIIQTAASGIYGALCMGTVGLYEIERWPMMLSSALHCLIAILPYVPLSLLLGWSEKASDVLIMAGFQFAAYVTVWFIMYMKYRSEVKKLNEIQKNRPSGDNSVSRL
ncbi:MAG: DUF3021 domain-containing protein [Clostridia bacterium]|nr:DUF3021 domain-containing protein [Clostridia bacterium]